MKKATLLILLLLVLPLASAFTFVQDRGSATLYPGDSTKFWILLKSDHAEKVMLTPSSGMNQWYTMNEYIVNLNNSEKNVSFYITVPKDATDANYLFRLSLNNGTDTQKALWIIKVTHGQVNRLSLKGFYFPELLEPGKTYQYRFDIQNSGNTILYNVRVELGDEKGQLLDRQYLIKELKPGQLYRVSENLTINKTASPRSFTVKLSASWNGKQMLSDERHTSIKKVEKLSSKKWGNILFIGFERREKITNLGNAEVKVELTRNMSGLSALFPVTNGRIEHGKFVWSADLKPGESIEISYGWNIFWFLVVSAVVFALLVFLMKKMAMPSLRKEVHPGKELKVFITVKNRSMSELKDVVVRDYVLPLFSPSPGKHGPKPRIKKGKKRFVISWRIPKLLPGEERILSYSLKPVLVAKGKIEFGKAELAARRDTVVVRAKSNNVQAEVSE